MSIDELVNRAYTTWTRDTGTKWSDLMRAALTEQAEVKALSDCAYKMRISNLEGRIREFEAQRVPEGWKLVPARCPLCEYRHGHQIGCANNPVDIDLLAAAQLKREEAIVRSSIMAYNEALAGMPDSPAYTTHERLAYEIGERHRSVRRQQCPTHGQWASACTCKGKGGDWA